MSDFAHMTNQTEMKDDVARSTSSVEQMETPGVRFPPPLLVLICLIFGLGVDCFAKTSFGANFRYVKWLGVGLVLLGLGISLWVALLYRKAKTSILPHTADSTMIESGPFAWSRNPIYLSMLLVFMGVCFGLNAPLALPFVIFAYLGLRYYVVAREEAYLVRRFGEVYTSYQSRVRRWI